MDPGVKKYIATAKDKANPENQSRKDHLFEKFVPNWCKDISRLSLAVVENKTFCKISKSINI